MKTIRLKQAFSNLAFLSVLALGAIKVFVLPVLGAYVLVYFLFADTWKDTTFVPYMSLFLTTVGPIVWVTGTGCLFAKFHRMPDHETEGSAGQ
jgi:hypothetical protein